MYYLKNPAGNPGRKNPITPKEYSNLPAIYRLDYREGDLTAFQGPSATPDTRLPFSGTSNESDSDFPTGAQDFDGNYPAPSFDYPDLGSSPDPGPSFDGFGGGDFGGGGSDGNW